MSNRYICDWPDHSVVGVPCPRCQPVDDDSHEALQHAVADVLDGVDGDRAQTVAQDALQVAIEHGYDDDPAMLAVALIAKLAEEVSA